MFKFLKKKISGAVSKISKDVEEKGVEKSIEIEQKEDKSGFSKKKKEEFSKKTETEIVKEEKEEVIEIKETPKEKGILSKFKQKVTTKTIDEKQFDDLFWELEIILLENNVAMEVIEKIKEDLKQNLVNKPIKKSEIEKTINNSLKQSIEEILIEGEDLLKLINKKPYVIVFLGSNGAGKTTTIAKVAKLLQDNNLKPVLAAADTFRSAAIQQLEEHANNLEVPMIKHDYGSDPTAVAFDAVKMAKAKHLDVVLIDTAGRQHSNVNLLDEMKKLIRVVNPDLKIYIGEMIAGNDCIEQIQSFDKAIQIDGVILTKSEIDEKGGTAISTSYVTKKPIYFLGTGQEYKDLEKFDKKKILEKLGF